ASLRLPWSDTLLLPPPCLLLLPRLPPSPLFPYTTLFRSEHPHILPLYDFGEVEKFRYLVMRYVTGGSLAQRIERERLSMQEFLRSEEHTSELQSRVDLVCRLLLEKKKRPQAESSKPADSH